MVHVDWEREELIARRSSYGKKNWEIHRVPLSPELIELLSGMEANVEMSRSIRLHGVQRLARLETSTASHECTAV
jgi:hypothetical protein